MIDRTRKLFHNLNKEILLISSLVIFSVLLGVISMWDVPLYSDSAFHAANVRKLLRTGYFPTYSAVGWVVPDMHPLSFEPLLTHPPLYYVLAAEIETLGINAISTFSLLNIVPTAFSAVFFYKLVYSFFSKRVALISTFLFVFAPMHIWLENHRIMEPIQYFLSLAALLYAKRFTETKENKYIFLTALFSCGVLYIKITSLFVVVAIFVFLILKKVSLKALIIFILLTTLFYLPYFGYSVTTRGTVSYSGPGLPVIDKYILKPWWNWEQNDIEKELSLLSDQEGLFNRLMEFDTKRRGFVEEFKSFRVLNVLQFYSIFPVTNESNNHWFSPEKAFTGLFLVIFVFGTVRYITKYRASKYHFFLIPLGLVITYYLTKTGELRYFYILNILLITMFALGLDEIHKLWGKHSAAFVYTVFTVSVILVTIREIDHSYQYRHSFLHNIMAEGNGISELKNINPDLLADSTTHVFTPATSDVAYYLDRRTVADYRMYFIPESEVDKYLDLYEVSLIILPNFYTTPSFYSYTYGTKVDNNMAHWEGTTIPLDSGFYSYLSNPQNIQEVQKFNAFTVYKRKE